MVYGVVGLLPILKHPVNLARLTSAHSMALRSVLVRALIYIDVAGEVDWFWVGKLGVVGMKGPWARRISSRNTVFILLVRARADSVPIRGFPEKTAFVKTHREVL